MPRIDEHAPATFEKEVTDAQRYFDSARFEGITRLYTARQVVEQRGTIPVDYTVAREASTAFHARLRELFSQGKSITTFGPYSPGQAVTMKRCGIEGIYLGGGRPRPRVPRPRIQALTWPVIRSARCPTRQPAWCVPC